VVVDKKTPTPTIRLPRKIVQQGRMDVVAVVAVTDLKIHHMWQLALQRTWLDAAELLKAHEQDEVVPDFRFSVHGI
jgi:hypothetical protein